MSLKLGNDMKVVCEDAETESLLHSLPPQKKKEVRVPSYTFFTLE
jgi:hypothetical protein